jgi:hypothetical protein
MGMAARVGGGVVECQQPVAVLPVAAVFQHRLQYGMADLLPGLGRHGQRLFPARGIGWQLLQGGQHLLLQPVLQLAGGRAFALLQCALQGGCWPAALRAVVLRQGEGAAGVFGQLLLQLVAQAGWERARMSSASRQQWPWWSSTRTGLPW